MLGSVAFPLLHGASGAAAAGPLPVGSSGGANLVFSDEFDGTALNAGQVAHLLVVGRHDLLHRDEQRA